MIALLTSCGRPDLLEKTLESLLKIDNVEIIIHEDSSDLGLAKTCWTISEGYESVDDLILTKGLGQHGSIEMFLKQNRGNAYYLHLEDDWEFDGTTEWIKHSIELMEENTKIIKVLAREGSPHPCNHDRELILSPTKSFKYGFMQPWSSADGTLWNGFSWNPGITRLEALLEFTPFPKWEQELATSIYNAGYLVAELAIPVYKHIGDGHSTHG